MFLQCTSSEELASASVTVALERGVFDNQIRGTTALNQLGSDAGLVATEVAQSLKNLRERFRLSKCGF